MKQLPRLLPGLLLLAAACDIPPPQQARPASKPGPPPARLELVPEPDRAERLRYEALAAQRQTDCVLADPDTAVSGINLADAASLARVLGPGRRDDQDGNYRYRSPDGRQTLTLTHYEGDTRDYMSLFRVALAGPADRQYPRLPGATFRTGRGIRLGMTKAQVQARLGTCCARLDSSAAGLTLRYQIDSPQDSRAHLLARCNMPGYYGTYQFRQDTLREFEFGFVYP